MAQRGCFIVIEGIDGSGKSTQATLLGKAIDALSLAEPSTGEWGKKIRQILGGTDLPPVEEQLELFIEDRRDDAARNISPALEGGTHIVMDRYYYSNAAYQGALGLDPRMILARNLEENFPKPDRVYFIDITPEEALRRIGARNSDGHRDLFERGPFLEKVRNIFLSFEDSSFVVIQGDASPEEVHQRIIEDLHQNIPRLITQ